MNLRLRRIGLGSAAKFGFVTGAVTATPIGIVLAYVVHIAIGWLRHFLEGWQHATIDAGLLGKIDLDMIRLLKLGDALATLRKLDELPLVVVAVAYLVVVVIAGTLSAMFTSWQAFAYNSMAALSGGLIVEVEPKGESRMIVVRGRKT